MLQIINKPNFIFPIDLLRSLLVVLNTRYSYDFSMSISFYDRKEMFSLNKGILNHYTDTDVITFCNNDAQTPIIESIMSSFMLIENAVKHNVSFFLELQRLMVHSYLHCVGFNDSNASLKTQMTNEENICLDLFHVKLSKYEV